MKYVFMFVLVSAILSGCGMKQSLGEVQNTSVAFVEHMVKGDYEQLFTQINWDQEGLVKDSVIDYFDVLRYRVQSDFGRDLQYKALGYKQNQLIWTSNPDARQEFGGKPGVKYSYVQISDPFRFSVFQLGLDANNKVLSINMANDIYPIPDSTRFWSIGILLLVIVLAFNIFVLVRVYKSDVTRKWLKYLIVVLVNIPAIGSKLMGGWFFKMFSFQLMGIGFAAHSYLDAYWVIGLPLGAIIVFWKLRNNLYRTQEDDSFYEEAARDALNSPE